MEMNKQLNEQMSIIGVASALRTGRNVLGDFIESQKSIAEVIDAIKSIKKSSQCFMDFLERGCAAMELMEQIPPCLISDINQLLTMCLAIDKFVEDEENLKDIFKVAHFTFELTEKSFEIEVLPDSARAKFVRAMHGALTVKSMATHADSEIEKDECAQKCRCSSGKQERKQSKSERKKVSDYDAMSAMSLKAKGIVKRPSARPCSKCGCPTNYFDIGTEKRICSSQCKGE